LAIAAAAPSGPTLARLMAAAIGPEIGPVIELGPGTGVFTRTLQGRMVATENLLLIEPSPAFTLLLRERFPDMVIICDLAQRLDDHARARLPDASSAIVSGLQSVGLSWCIA